MRVSKLACFNRVSHPIFLIQQQERFCCSKYIISQQNCISLFLLFHLLLPLPVHQLKMTCLRLLKAAHSLLLKSQIQLLLSGIL